MTSLELFSVWLTVGGLVVAGIYTYAVNRSPSHLKGSEADGSSETLTKETQARHQASEKQLEEAVTRADLAAASAEAAAVRAEAASQARNASQVRQAASVVYASAAAMAGKPYAGLNLKQYMVVHPSGGIGPVVGQDGSFMLESISGRVIKAEAEEQSARQGDASTPNYASIQ